MLKFFLFKIVVLFIVAPEITTTDGMVNFTVFEIAVISLYLYYNIFSFIIIVRLLLLRLLI